MVGKHLPNGADINGGGSDLRFPHHENELAQSRCAHPESTFVRAWAHHGMVSFSEGKMAKSTGNILAVDEVVDERVDRGQPGEVHLRRPHDAQAGDGRP